MTEPEVADPDVQLSGSGGTMTRLSGPASSRPVDLSRLESLPAAESDAAWTPAGRTPFHAPGDVVLWRYGRSADPVRVVRDDERGLVAWLPTATETLAFVPADGRPLRARPAAERFDVERVAVVRRWEGPGILRIAPTGKPWALWYFWDERGGFEGHYVNLELPHRRHGVETNTRDLVLDLWLEPDGELWLKDADELAAATASGRFAPDQAEEIHAIAEQARVELVEPRAWPLDEDWEGWRPPAAWQAPLSLPDTPLVLEARARRTVAP